jgi:hypothetical protein
MILKATVGPEISQPGYDLVSHQLKAIAQFQLAQQQAATQFRGQHNQLLEGINQQTGKFESFPTEWNKMADPGTFWYMNLTPQQRALYTSRMQNNDDGSANIEGRKALATMAKHAQALRDAGLLGQ